jgi:hypothetical protein
MVLFHKYIQELLFLYDCVVIPDFGGFVCSFSPAKIHPVQHRFHPPGKHISFNRMLTMNDGLLAQYISLSEKIAYNEALQQIKTQVSTWKDDLKNTGSIELQGIGKFFLDHAGNLQFEYETEMNFLADSFGLSTFQSLPVDRSRSMKVVHRNIEKEASEVNTMPVLNKLAKYSIAAAFISMTALATYKMDLLSNFHLDKISLLPFRTEAPAYKSVKYADVKLDREAREISLEEKMAKSEASYLDYEIEVEGIKYLLKVKLKEEEKLKNQANASPGKYHVVGGCFSVEANASNMLRKLKKMGFEADMSVMHKGLHVVSYQSFSTDEKARKFLKKVKSEQNNQAWLLVK